MPPAFIKNVIRYAVPRRARNWLRSPTRSLERISDSVRFSLGLTKTLQIGPDIAITMHPHAYKVAYRAQILDPEQRAEFENFITRCDRQMFLFDIGAHYGIFSLLTAHFGGKSIAVDPSAAAIRMIKRQVDLNNQSQRIRTLHAAVSSSTGSLKMLSSGVFSDDYLRVAMGRPSRELTEIRAVTIDSMTAEFGVPTHIKIDVEGQEGAVLRGGHRTLRQYSPELFLELHNQLILEDGGDPNVALDELSALGYYTFSLDGLPMGKDLIFQQPVVRIIAAKTSSWQPKRQSVFVEGSPA